MNPFRTQTPVAATPVTPKPVAPMPDPDSPEAMEARRKVNRDIMGRAGRASTILSAPEGRGGDYSSSKLG